MPFFSCVCLKNSDEIFVIKSTWWEGLYSARTKNNAARPTVLRKIFYSPRLYDVPNFTLEVQQEFRSDQMACYEGRVLKTFNTKAAADHFKWGKNFNRRIRQPNRRGRPKISENNLRRELEFKLEEINRMEGCWKNLNNRTRQQVLTDSDLEEIEEILSSDDDDESVEVSNGEHSYAVHGIASSLTTVADTNVVAGQASDASTSSRTVLENQQNGASNGDRIDVNNFSNEPQSNASDSELTININDASTGTSVMDMTDPLPETVDSAYSTAINTNAEPGHFSDASASNQTVIENQKNGVSYDEKTDANNCFSELQRNSPAPESIFIDNNTLKQSTLMKIDVVETNEPLPIGVISTVVNTNAELGQASDAGTSSRAVLENQQNGASNGDRINANSFSSERQSNTSDPELTVNINDALTGTTVMDMTDPLPETIDGANWTAANTNAGPSHFYDASASNQTVIKNQQDGISYNDKSDANNCFSELQRNTPAPESIFIDNNTLKESTLMKIDVVETNEILPIAVISTVINTNVEPGQAPESNLSSRAEHKIQQNGASDGERIDVNNFSTEHQSNAFDSELFDNNFSEGNVLIENVESASVSSPPQFLGFDVLTDEYREMDLNFSQNYRFYEDQNGDRIYKLQTCIIKLNAKTMKNLKFLDESYPAIVYDSKYLMQLAMDIFGKKTLAKSSVGGTRARNADVQHQPLDPEKLVFMRDVFGQRTRNAVERQERFNKILNKHCNNARRK